MRDFYVPALELADTYDRAVGFFSSHALALVSTGLDSFVARGGRMRVLASPKNLSEEDLEAIVRGEAARQLLKDSLADGLAQPETPSELNNLQLLSWMVSQGLLDVRIALRVMSDGRVTLYHKKVGVFTSFGDPLEWMTFTGSPNETAGGLTLNAEAFPLHRSWIDGQREFAVSERSLFDSAWNKKRPEIWTWTATSWLGDALRERFGERPPRTPVVYIDVPAKRPSAEDERWPSMPEDFRPRPYQRAAVDAWIQGGGRGTFAMATGTGKTETALAASVEAVAASVSAKRPLVILVTVPLSDLVDQWLSRARRFGFRPIRWDGQSSPAERQTALDAFRRADAGRTGPYVAMVVATADSLTGALREVVREFRGGLMIIGDEMHSLGTPNRLDALPPLPTFTLGLSATPKRHHDDEGTERLLAYFGDPVLSINIKQAIYEYRALCPYRYHIDFVELSADEAAEYKRLSRLIAAALGVGRDADAHIRARSNVVSHAEAKVQALAAIMSSPPDFRSAQHLLVYVGEGAARGAHESSLRRVADLLGNRFQMRVSSYTSETPSDERRRLQERLASGELQALIAMRCLDEGVDIPEARVGIMMASTQNPRQFVQRRGRILRRSPGKTIADVHDMLVLPPINHDMLDSDRTLLASELARAYELADAAENRNSAMQAVRERALAGGLIDEDFPWMSDLTDDAWEEWTRSEGRGRG
ncbi:helicase-related protein [Geodermatophilus sabuli]|uniref:helicase-related protein n=1 Tax=Geodermatophilus sabuli TaxID=1564158 RepID=UPI001559F9B0|nr:helicase-related protein [Geodermatophilus sabuli]MBB3084694.1 superfamily II DNA or RNA helicase [Geodermatophilus sabuli]